jgi:protein-disulfide isomerase
VRGHHLTLPVGARDHAEGGAEAPVTLVEYGDYECPSCGRAYPIVKAIQQRFGGRLRFVFRNFPLTGAHPHAELAAEAAEAASRQGRFWEMHDALFEHQSDLDGEALVAYAAEVGLDLERWLEDLQSHAFAARVREDFMSGVRSGVPGTPAFFIDGEAYEGQPDYEPLSAAIDAAIQRRAGPRA